MSYTVGGSATAGADYTALTGSVTILAGQLSALIDVTVLNDVVVEGNETVTVTLNSITSGDPDISINGAASSDTVTIADDGDTAQVSIVANDAAAGEPANNGQFTVSLSAVSSTDTVISYTVGGSATAGMDYTALTGSVTILASQLSALIDVSVLNDVVVEGNETVTVTLNSITSGDPQISIGAANTDTVTIADDGDAAQVSIVANDAAAGEPANNGQFTVSLSAVSSTDTVISYTVGGSAAAGMDYTALSGSVTILAGQLSALIDVSVLNDAVVEGNETVTVTLNSVTSGDADITIGAANSDTVTIADDGDTAQVSIVANDAAAGEPANNGQFTVSLSAASSTDTVISYTVGGTATAGADYTALTGSVTILAGQLSALIDVTVLNDVVVEGNETVTVTLNSITSGDPDISINGAANSDTVTIADDGDTAQVSIVANDAAAGEPANNGQFTVSLSAVSSTDTVISYAVGGTATAGMDYTALTGSVTILAGQLSALIDVSVLNDVVVEGNETVTVALNSITAGDPEISIGAANTDTVTIADDGDAAQVSIVANDAAAGEPANDGQFTVSLSAVSSTDTVVSYTVGGTATAGTDYTALTGSVTILAGQLSALIDVSVAQRRRGRGQRDGDGDAEQHHLRRPGHQHQRRREL